jgi:hypothetical protein
VRAVVIFPAIDPLLLGRGVLAGDDLTLRLGVFGMICFGVVAGRDLTLSLRFERISILKFLNHACYRTNAVSCM